MEACATIQFEKTVFPKGVFELTESDFFKLINALISNCRYGMVVGLLRRFLLINPDHLFAIVTITGAYSELGEYDNVVKWAKRGIELDEEIQVKKRKKETRIDDEK